MFTRFALIMQYITYITILQLSINLQLVNTNGPLERKTEQALLNGGVCPDRYFRFGATIQPWISDAQTELLGNQDTRLHVVRVLKT